jgi:ParB/RepB/Spo0J family partition protein
LTKDEIIQIPTAAITPDPENLRKVFDKEDLDSLADNLREHGQLDPIQVFRREDGSFDLWDGERRWRAAKIAGIESIRAIIVPRPSPVDLLCKKISRSMQTRSLSFPEEVHALEEGLTALSVRDQPKRWAWAARKLGVTPALLRERMRITNLTKTLRQQFEEGKIDYSVSQALGKVDDPKLQEKIAEFVVKEDVSDRFAVLQFMPTVLQDPKRSLMESYDIAKRNEKYRYAAPRKSEELPQDIENRIDEMLSDFRKCLRWLEAAGRQDLISFLHPTNFNTRRVLATLRHLHQMIAAFISAYQTRYGPAEAGPRKRNKKTLPTTLRLLEADLNKKKTS